MRHLDLAARLAGGAPLAERRHPGRRARHGLAAHAHWLLGHDDEALSSDATRPSSWPGRSTTRTAWPWPWPMAASPTRCVTTCPRSEGTVAELRGLCDRYGFAYYREWALILDGWSRADGEPGIDLARQGISNLKAEGSLARMPYWLSLMADLFGADPPPRPGPGDSRRGARRRACPRRHVVAAGGHAHARRLRRRESAAIARLRSAAQMASAQGSVALLRRCEHDLARRGVRPPASRRSPSPA